MNHSFRRTILTSLLVACSLGVLVPISVLAVDIVVTIPGSSDASDPGGIVANVYQFSIMIGGVVGFGAVVYGGLKYSLAAGDPTKQSDARDQILQAFYGLILLLGVYLILNVIDPNLLNLHLPSLSSP